MKKFIPHLLAFTIILGSGGLIVHAQSNGTGGGPTNTTGGGPTGISATIDNPFNCGGTNNNNCTLDVLLNSVIQNIVLPLGGIIVVLAFIWVGFMFVKARGNPTEIGTAKNALLYVAIGTAVLLGASIISAVIQNTAKQL